MKKDKELLRKVRQGVCSVALLSACMVNMTSCNDYDLDERDPEGWGANIYSFLEESGNYKNVTRLIQDLGLKEKLEKTISSTLFASNDEAYDRFYANNKWGVSNYDQLTLAQKKMLLKGSMISNPYQVNDLSSTENRIEGMCMRRTSWQNMLDTVPVYKCADLPNMQPEDWKWNSFWKRFQNRDELVLFQDQTTPPMLHFIENFMVNNKITNDDYDFLFNIKDPAQKRQSGDASVNGVKIISQNNRCSNGFIHEMSDVIMPLSNMAETIRQDEDLSIYSKLLERFAFPHYVGKELTDLYNNNFGTNVDSVFEKRYFSAKSHNDDNNGSTWLIKDDNRIYFVGSAEQESDNTQHQALMSKVLPYDPGWNTYYTGDLNTTADERMKNDMGVMLVPSNKAMTEFWNADKGPGKALRKQYPDGINTVPNDVIVELLKNNMLTEFTKSVPSKFSNILNSNNDPMGITMNDVERVALANNGAIYVTNKVFAPTEYVSVLFPSTVNETMSIMKWAIEANDYNVYLNSLQSTYNLFIHTNDCLDYIDPLSILNPTAEGWKLWRFHYNKDTKSVYADIHAYNPDTKQIIITADDERVTDAGLLKLRLREILDACIIVNEPLDDSKEYYRTMGYQTIRIKNPSAAKSGGMTVMGSQQINEQKGAKPIRITEVYDQTKETNDVGNGMCYIINSEPTDIQNPLTGTFKSTIQMMEETVNDNIHNPNGEMSEFLKLIKDNNSQVFTESIKDQSYLLTEKVRDNKYFAFTNNIKSFNTFHYTVYVPTNNSVRAWLAENSLVDPNDPTLSGWKYIYSIPEDDPKREVLTKRLADFVKYHFQDQSFFIGGKGDRGEFSTAFIDGDKFKKVYTTSDGNNISIKDAKGNVRKVVKSSGLYNIMAREYFFHDGRWYEKGTEPAVHTQELCDRLYGASSIVIHLIDAPLLSK